MKKFISIILILTTLIFLFCSCRKAEISQSDFEQLTYYAVDDKSYPMYELIEKYNNYCKRVKHPENAIKVIEFSSENEMYTKMTTEIMSGKGPDLFSLDQNIPFEKLLNSRTFADVNEIVKYDDSKNKIDFNDFNEIVMNTGVSNGKRYIVPLFYGVDIMIADKEELDRYNIDLPQGYSLIYKNIDKDFNNFFSNRSDDYFIEYTGDDYYYYNSDFCKLFYNLIDNFIDKENKNTYFDTDEFITALNYINKIRENSGPMLDNIAWNKAVFHELLFPPVFFKCFSYIAYRQNSNQVLMKGYTRFADDNPAHIELGIAFNGNCKKYDKINEFLKYALSEDIQERFCYAKGNTLYRFTHPVRKDAFEKSIKSAGEIENDDGIVIGTDNAFMQTYINISKNITRCTLFDNSFCMSDYYYSSVVNDLITDYLNDKISQKKFIRDLTSATQIYLYE